MSAKQIRKAKLVYLHQILSNPHIPTLTASVVHSPEQLQEMLNITTYLLKADGVVGIDPKAKVNGE